MVHAIGDSMEGKYDFLAASDYGMMYAAPLGSGRILEINTVQGAMPPWADYGARAMADPVYSDVALLVEGERFPAHRVILARVPFFRALFDQDFLERNSAELTIGEVPAAAFRVALHFIYTDDVRPVRQSDELPLLDGILACAERLELAPLKIAAAQRICSIFQASTEQFPVGVALQWFMTSRMYRLPALQRICLQQLKGLGPATIMMAPEFVSLFNTDHEAYTMIVRAVTGR